MTASRSAARFAAALVVAAAAVLLSTTCAQEEPLLQVLSEVPQTSFSCEGRAFGFYADVEASCQAFHICSGSGRQKWSMLCPNQTLFNQKYLVCDYPSRVDCNAAEQLYVINERLGDPQARLIDDK